MRKGENAGYQHFALFPKCFKVINSQDCVVKSLKMYLINSAMYN